MNNALQTLKERGFYAQCTDPEALSALMDAGPVSFYEGTDPTGPSLHIGHLVPFFAGRHLLAAGHRFIVLVGGGTARIGDPSGKTETRQMLSYDTLDANAASIQAQLTRFLGPVTGAAGTVNFANNKDWLAGLNYIDFLREIGSHFSVNRMLSFESYKMRMETGLSFIEFNYQLLQSYDYLQLYRRQGCRLQIGGDDQWGNIVAGADLIRRIEGAEVYGLTFPLITRADGKKMGKSEKGAVFLDPAKTAVYDFFQYWRNIQDADLRRFLLMFTFLPVDECEALAAPGKNPNEAKERLAWEVTALIHGKDEADKALAGVRAVFGDRLGGDCLSGDRSALPTVSLPRSRFEAGYPVVELLSDAKLAVSRSEARRLVEQGGAFVQAPSGGLAAIAALNAAIGIDALDDRGELILRAGKKRYCRVVTG
ncbi:MAG: tyrosine--tRNA ligase [Treponema sp.]|jgi:tyrosyl-tRNA synthetase|nr:tyrosine--tRNA ligase [Treponema sp.]